MRRSVRGSSMRELIISLSGLLAGTGRVLRGAAPGIRRPRLLVLWLLALGLAISSPAVAIDGQGEGGEAGAAPPPSATVYFFRPMGGKFASPEMDRLASKIEARGINAEVFNYTGWIRPAKAAVARYKSEAVKNPIIVVGHSAGGDSAIRFASYLNRSRIPVDLIITLDPTRIPRAVPRNVERYINIYSSLNTFGGGAPRPARDFQGHFASVDLKNLSVLHRYLPAISELQDAVVNKIAVVAANPDAPPGPTLRIAYPIPQGKPIILFDAGISVVVQEGDSAASIAAQYGVPPWVVAAMNGGINPGRKLTPGEKLRVPRYVGPAS